MTFEGYIAFAGVIGFPLSIFLIQSFVDKRVELGLKVHRSQIKQLQELVQVLLIRSKPDSDPETFIRD